LRDQGQDSVLFRSTCDISEIFWVYPRSLWGFETERGALFFPSSTTRLRQIYGVLLSGKLPTHGALNICPFYAIFCAGKCGAEVSGSGDARVAFFVSLQRINTSFWGSGVPPPVWFYSIYLVVFLLVPPCNFRKLFFVLFGLLTFGCTSS
jgi:hypothetical protein